MRLTSFCGIVSTLIAAEVRRNLHTVIVNLLYGNNRGMRLKKLSSYSPSITALSATCARTGLSDGGNLPFVSQFSFAIASLRTSMAASRSGWKGCCSE